MATGRTLSLSCRMTSNCHSRGPDDVDDVITNRVEAASPNLT